MNYGQKAVLAIPAYFKLVISFRKGFKKPAYFQCVPRGKGLLPI